MPPEDDELKEDVRNQKMGEYFDHLADTLDPCTCGASGPENWEQKSYLSHFMFGEVEFECKNCGKLRTIEVPR